jgi:tetraacyldisaccharide 4'-kinase
LEQARDEKLVPVTTSKDAARLRGMGREQDSLRSVSKVLNIQIAFENPNMLEMVINSTIKNAETRRIKSAG